MSTAPFTERFVQVDKVRLRYLEAGHGSPVVVLYGHNALSPSPLDILLAQQFRVIALEMPSSSQATPRETAQTLTRAVDAAGIEHYTLISTSTSTLYALWQALETPEHVDALVLVSPPALHANSQAETNGNPRDPELLGRLREVQAPTLVLLGTNDTSVPANTGQRYVEQLSNCYYTLVYDAGPAMATERPEALFATVSDFIERRGTFIVERDSSALKP
ncbi:MAG: alpha/beta fold hydrolase [Candidatus Binatia bacterium]